MNELELKIRSGLFSLQMTNNLSYIDRSCSVYCDGPILKHVQLAAIFNDSKTFVDMPMIYEPETTLDAFNKIADPTNKTALINFLNSYFLEAGSDLVSWIPTDFNDNPSILATMPEDYPYKQWTSDLNQLWKLLGRNISQVVVANPEKHSFLPRNHPMIVPGGRFRESYYWDSYWIIRGLLVCNMNETAFHVISNLLDDVENFGFVPNGGRVYYLDRSQPPLLSDMVWSYYTYMVQQHGGIALPSDQTFLSSAYEVLRREYAWWMASAQGHMVTLTDPHTGTIYSLNRYHSNYTTPRPESYLADYENYQKTPINNTAFYRNVRAGAETGWDFSSRWLRDGFNLTSIETSSIVPVELNSVLFRYEKNMENIEKSLGIPLKDVDFAAAANNRAQAMSLFLYDSSGAHWRDFNLTSNNFALPPGPSPGQYRTVAGWLPLWAGLSPPSGSSVDAVVESLQQSDLVQRGGVLTTNLLTGQQWDSPNAWAPLVLMVIEGLRQVNSSLSLDLAVSDTIYMLCDVI